MSASASGSLSTTISAVCGSSSSPLGEIQAIPGSRYPLVTAGSAV